MIPPYRNRHVRDLAWAIFSPPLLDSTALDSYLKDADFELTASRTQWLQRLDEAPAPLHRFLTPLGGRLGLHYERLWQFFLQQDPAVELLAHNLPVHDAGRTLGEFDLLYRLPASGRVIHLELAVKYYLRAQPQTSHTLSAWLGPNRRDRLDLKVDRLLAHQTRLSEHAAARTVLNQYGVQHCERRLRVHGYLFAQPGDGKPPDELHRDRSLQDWLPLVALEDVLPDGRFRILPRLQWLAPARCSDDGAPPCDRETLLSTLQAELTPGAQPRLVARFGADDAEQQRFFVTPDHWPHDGDRSQS